MSTGRTGACRSSRRLSREMAPGLKSPPFSLNQALRPVHTGSDKATVGVWLRVRPQRGNIAPGSERDVPMGEIVNLNQARKARAKAEAGKQAKANRVLHGRTKGESLKAQLEAERERRRLDQARRDED